VRSRTVERAVGGQSVVSVSATGGHRYRSTQNSTNINRLDTAGQTDSAASVLQSSPGHCRRHHLDRALSLDSHAGLFADASFRLSSCVRRTPTQNNVVHVELVPVRLALLSSLF